MVTINNLYEVKMECTGQSETSNSYDAYPLSYNIPIDNYLIIKISLIDFNGNAVTGTDPPNTSTRNVHIKCDKGKFVSFRSSTTGNASQQWSSLTGGNQKECDVRINSLGVAEIMYQATEWGLCTISADVNKLQFFITGFKNTNLAKTPTNTSVFQVDESMRACRLKYTLPSTSITNSTVYLDENIIPVKYRPNKKRYYIAHRPDVAVTLTNEGSIGVRRGTTGSNFTIDATDILMEWRY